MKCPIDTAVDLVIAERRGIEIDYCPTCRGVWLDRGELDKIISQDARVDDDRDVRDVRDSRHDRDDSGKGKRSRRRKESFLGDLFDFG